MASAHQLLRTWYHKAQRHELPTRGARIRQSRSTLLSLLTRSPHYSSAFGCGPCVKRTVALLCITPTGVRNGLHIHKYLAPLRMPTTCGGCLGYLKGTVPGRVNPRVQTGSCIMLDDTGVLSHLAVPLGAAVFLIALARYLRPRGTLGKSSLPYPPGPKGLPLVGNALDFPRGMPIWEGFSQMAETYRTSMVLTIWQGTHDQTPTQRRTLCTLTCLEQK